MDQVMKRNQLPLHRHKTISEDSDCFMLQSGFERTPQMWIIDKFVSNWIAEANRLTIWGLCQQPWRCCTRTIIRMLESQNEVVLSCCSDVGHQHHEQSTGAIYQDCLDPFCIVGLGKKWVCHLNDKQRKPAAEFNLSQNGYGNWFIY